MRTIVKAASSLVLLALLGAVAWTQEASQQIPLGDLVKQKPAKKAKRVVTNEDIPARPPEAASASSAQAPTAAGEGATPSQPAKADAEKPQSNQPDAGKGSDTQSPDQKPKTKIEQLKEQEEIERRNIRKVEDLLADPSLSENRRTLYEEVVRLSREQLARCAAEREQLEKQATPPPN